MASFLDALLQSGLPQRGGGAGFIGRGQQPNWPTFNPPTTSGGVSNQMFGGPANTQQKPTKPPQSMSDIMEMVMQRFQNIQNPQLPTQQGMNMSLSDVEKYKQQYTQQRTQAYGARHQPKF
jgi:hypothetical protein